MSAEENRMLAPQLSAEGPRDEGLVVRWSSFARIAFRFAFCYLVLYCLYLADTLEGFLLFAASKGSRFPDGFMSPLWHVAIPLVGQHILHLNTAITIFSNSSADTTYDYVLVLCELAIAAIATIFWSILDRGRPNYCILHQWLRLAVRLCLAGQMIAYGMDKAIPLQFGTLQLHTLIKPLGEMSPIGLLWSFMAASTPYTVISGVAEVLGGILVLISPTVTLGALVSLAAISNVVALNLSYDVPVKLMSFHLLVLSAFLLAPEARRLANVLIFNRTAEPVAYAAFSKRISINRAAVILPPVWGIFLFSFFLFFNYRIWSTRQEMAADHGPLYGVWDVEQFSNAGPSAGPLFTAKLQQDMQIAPGEDSWQRVLFESGNIVVLQLKGGVLDEVDASLDQNQGSLSFSDSADLDWKCTFSLRKPAASMLNLQGYVNGTPVSITLRRVDDSKYPLTSRGFHWISEHAFFR